MNTAIQAACRAVTAEECDHYNEHGWVKLEGFLAAEVVGEMLSLAVARMGADGDGNPLREASGQSTDAPNVGHFNPEGIRGLTSSVLKPVILGAGQATKLLMYRRRGDIGVRYHFDALIPKLPASKSTKHDGNGPTPYHHDSPAADRTGGMSFWMPLEAYGPESGTMSFVSGSHRNGVMGEYSTFMRGVDIFEAYPDLRDMPKSEFLTYGIGDVSVHSDLTVHGANPNTTDCPRWAYLLHLSPADSCWNGAPMRGYDTSKMRPFEPFPERHFPLVA